MWALIVKEFRQMRRDHRTLALMIVMPILLLVVLGYAASFDVNSVATVVAGPQARTAMSTLHKPLDVKRVAPAKGMAWARAELRDGHAVVAVVTGVPRTTVLIDGSQLFAARRALTALSSSALGSARGGPGAPAAAPGQAASLPAVIHILYNPLLKTSDVMIPGIAGVVLVFVGTVITSLGVVREREAGTLEQLAVMPFRPRDVFLGKICPYFAVATLDLGIVLAVGVAIFGVPFRGSMGVFALGALMFLFATLGMGVLISSVSENQGQAIQLAIMTLLPQVLMSGLIFPLGSIVAGIRWIAYLLPLTYFNQISRGVMLRAEPITALWLPFVCLAALGAVVVALATLRFRTFLLPASHARSRWRRAGGGAAPAALVGSGDRT